MTFLNVGSPDLWLGMLCSLLSASLFGSGFVLIKKRDPRDGVFTQWMMCNGIMLGGFCILVIFGLFGGVGFPQFYPLTAAGGTLFAIGNCLAVPIFMELGMGPAYLLPDIVNCLGSFVIGYFGLFGTNPQPPTTEWLAFAGLATIIAG